MRLNHKKATICFVLILSGLLMTGFTGAALESMPTAEKVSLIGEVSMETPLEETLQQLPEMAKMAAKTVEEIAAAEAAKKAAEDEAAKKAAEEAKRKEEERKAAAEAEQSLLAALIYCEAGGEPYEGQVAVGAVVLNRVRSASYPNSIREVIYQSGQFGPAITGKLDRVIASGKTTASCYQAAADALAGVNPIGSALYFGCGNYGQKIGGHWFH